jgi:hypothetical protein
MARPKKSEFEKAWTKERGANEKNKFLARKYWLSAMRFIEGTGSDRATEEINILES